MVVIEQPQAQQQPHCTPGHGHGPASASQVTLAKLLSLSGPVTPLVQGKREKGEFRTRILPSLQSALEWMPKD